MKHINLAAAAALLGAVLGASSAEGAVTFRVVAGTSCAAAAAPIPITTTGGTVTASVCIDTAGASERACAVGYPIVSANAAANAAAVQVQARSTTGSVFTNVIDLTVFAATLSTTATDFGQSVPPNGVQAGGSGANVKVAELTLTIPSGLPASTTFDYALAPTASATVGDTAFTNCNDLDAINVTSALAGTFSLATPGAVINASVTATTQASETGPTNGVLTFSRTGSTAAAQALTSAINGTAANPADYAFTAGTCTAVSGTSTLSLTIPAGSASCTVNVVPVDDSVVETGGETVIAAVPTGSGVTGTGSAATITIADNDVTPTVSVTASTSAANETGPVNGVFTFTRTGSTAAAQALTSAIAGTAANPADYTFTAGTCTAVSGTATLSLTIPAGSASCTVNVAVVDDAPTESAETVIAAAPTGSGVTPTGGSATVTIADNDGPPSVSVAVSGSPASENAGVLTYTFTRTGNAGQIAAALTGVNITAPAAGARFSTTCASPISFAADSTTATCTYTGIDNAVLDGNVNVAVAVASGSGYNIGSPATATGVIQDNEIGVSVAVTSGLITEGGLATFTLSCTGSGTFAVNYTVNTIGTDGAPTPASPASLTCGTPLNVTVQTAQNTTPADSRALTLTITSVGAGAAITPGAGSATVNVQDDDGPPPTIPTMGAFGLALLGLLMAGVAGFAQRRRK